MGYPFDRLPYSVQDITTNEYGQQVSGRPRMVRDLAEYVNGIPNIAAFQVRLILVSIEMHLSIVIAREWLCFRFA